NIASRICSRTRPSRRLHMIAAETMPVDRACCCFSERGEGSIQGESGVERGAAEAFHDRGADASLGKGFGNDFVDSQLIQLPQGKIETHGSFGKLPSAWAEGDDVLEIRQVKIAILVKTSVTQECVALFRIRG